MKKLFTAFAAVTMSLAAWAQANVPATFQFTDEASFAAWTVIDNNASASPNTWTLGSGEAVYTEDKKTAADDWLISPAVNLEAGAVYTIDYYIVQKSIYSFDKQKYAITVGTEATIAGQSTTLASNESFSSKLYSKQTCTFVAPTSGTYYLGVHLYSASYNGNCGFQKFEISKATVTPSQITDLSVVAGEAGTLTATLTWTAPTTSSADGALSQLSGVKVMRDGTQIADIPATVGQEMTYTDATITTAGTYEYSVIAYNEDGDAKGTATSVTSPWIGKDTPKAVTGLTATADGTQVSLTWTAPTEGTHGGYIDPAAIFYLITRDGMPITEEWAGELPYVDTVEGLAKYNYAVSPTYDNKVGAETSITVTAGDAYTLPYSETFDNASSMDFFTTFNNNGTRTWSHYSSKKCAQFWGGSEADAWLITPALKVEAGKTYKVTFNAGLENAVNASNYKDLYVSVGQGTTAEAQTNVIFNQTIQSALMEGKEAYFSVPATGNYNIGFRVLGKSSSYALFIDNILVEESRIIPAASTQLEVTPKVPVAGEDYKFDITWNNPATDLAGNPITHLDSVQVLLGHSLYHTFGPSTPGAAMSLECAVTEAGYYTIHIINYLDGVEGAVALRNTDWIGHDTPNPVTDVTLTDVDGVPTITFTAPTTGAHNGYLNTAALTYRIVRNPGDVEVADACNVTSFSDTQTLDLANYSYTVYAQVEGRNGMLVSEGATSNPVVFGTALSLPYEANFNDPNHMALWTIEDTNNDGKSWEYNANNAAMEYTCMRTAYDYLFTPPIMMGKGKARLSYGVKGYNYRYSDDYHVLLATAPQSWNRMEELEYVEQNTLQSSMYTTREVEFEVPATGIYYIAFYNTSSDSWGLYINSTFIELTEPATGINDINDEGYCYYNSKTQSLVWSGTAQVVVTAVNGSVVATAHDAQDTLDVSHLSAGMYIANININGKQHSIKFVK